MPILGTALWYMLVFLYTPMSEQQFHTRFGRASLDSVHYPTAKLSGRLFGDMPFSSGSTCNLLNGMSKDNRTLPDINDKWQDMLSGFKDEVQASTLSQACKRPFVQHINNFVSRYERLNVMDPIYLGEIQQVANIIDHHLLVLVHHLDELEIFYQQNDYAQTEAEIYPTMLVRQLNGHGFTSLPSSPQALNNLPRKLSRYTPNDVQSFLSHTIHCRSSQIWSCLSLESEPLTLLTIKLQERLNEWGYFSPSFFRNLDHYTLDQAILDAIWKGVVGRVSQGSRRLSLWIAMEKVRKQTVADLTKKLNGAESTEHLSLNIFVRFSDKKWIVVDGVPLSTWLQDRRSDLRKVADELRQDLRLRAEARKELWK
ncbi:MAG: hypothetical protein Q9169_004445 [Polycauliona sp. 2 TL-2023]